VLKQTANEVHLLEYSLHSLCVCPHYRMEGLAWNFSRKVYCIWCHNTS